MSDDRERWLKPDSPVDRRLSDLLDAGRSEAPSAAQQQALAARLADPWRGPGGGGGGGGGNGRGGAGSGAGGSLAAPALPGGVLALAVAATAAIGLWGAWWLVDQRGQSAANDRGEVPSVSVVSQMVAVADAGRVELVQAVVPDAGAPTAEAVGTDAGSPRGGRVHASRAVQPQHERPDPVAELLLLDAAQRVLASAPAQALAATERHAQRFPAGQLVQERELLAIEALVRLGRHDAARARGERFLSSYAGSSHAPRVRKLLASVAIKPGPAPAAPAAPGRH